MTSSSDIAAKFESAIEAFTAIVGQPKDNDLRGVRKVLLQTCLLIRLAGSKDGKVTGLILPDAAYKNQPGVTISFDKDDIHLKEYDPSFTQETEAWEQRKLRALWNTRLDNQYRIRTTKHAFEKVLYISLRNEDTYYEMVSLLELLSYFAEEIRCLEVTDVVTLIGELPGY